MSEKTYNMSKISEVLKFHRAAEKIRKQQLLEEYLALKIDEHLIHKGSHKTLSIPEYLVLDGNDIGPDMINDMLSRHRNIGICKNIRGTDFILDFNF